MEVKLKLIQSIVLLQLIETPLVFIIVMFVCGFLFIFCSYLINTALTNDI